MMLGTESAGKATCCEGASFPLSVSGSVCQKISSVRLEGEGNIILVAAISKPLAIAAVVSGASG